MGSDQCQYSYKRLKKNKTKIESAFGEELQWIPTGHTRNWHIVAPLDDVGGLRDPQRDWQATQDAMIATMARLEAAVALYLEEIAAKLWKPSREDTVPTFQTAYRPVNSRAPTTEKEPFAVDPNVIDRGTKATATFRRSLESSPKYAD